MKTLIISFIALTTIIINTSGQEILWKMNGEKQFINGYEYYNQNKIKYRNIKNKIKYIRVSKIFSITDSSGVEKIFYLPDSSKNKEYTIEQMKNFVQGAFDGYNNNKYKWAYIGGMIAAVPTIFTTIPYYIIIALIQPKIIINDIPVEYSTNDYYLAGYKKGAKRKMVRNSVVGSLATVSIAVAVVVAGAIIIIVGGGYDM